MTAEYRVQRLRLPTSVLGAEAREFLEFSELTDAVERQTWGHEDRCSPAEFRLGVWRDTRYEVTSLFFVRVGGRMAGRGWCQLPLKEDRDRATVRAEVLDEFSGRGIGRLLLAAATEEATRHGRSVLISFTEHPARPAAAAIGTVAPVPLATAAVTAVASDMATTAAPLGTADVDAEPAAVVVPSTGIGAVPATARSVRFARAAGFELSQVERFSELVLSEHDGGWPALEAAAAARAGGDYDIVVWEGVPAEHRVEMAGLLARMSTDVPYGVDQHEPAAWDSGRVAALEVQLADAGTLPLYAVARHRASGRLVAYTSLWIRAAKSDIADQDDTLVVPEHRGRSLGMRIKLANLRAYRERFPEARKIITFNAEENRHMLAINEALGFRTAGCDGEWYRRIR